MARRGTTRRELLGTLAGLAVLGPTVSGSSIATAEYAQPASTLSSTQAQVTSQDVSIESFDGTTIEATIYEPDQSGEFPAIVMTHGWAGNRTSLQGSGETYASEGYVALTYDSRGFGESGGQVNATSEKEANDSKAILDWLADRSSVQTDGPNDPVVGMDGASYGGGIQVRAAATESRVDAIVPRATWFNLLRALAPNDVIKIGWTDLLLTAGQAAGDLDPEFEDRATRIQNEFEVRDGDRQYFRSRSGVSFGDAQAPTLAIQEINDQLMPGEEGVDIYRWADDSGQEASLLLGNGTTHTFGADPPGEESFNQRADQAALAWFDDHLKGEGPNGLPSVTYYDAVLAQRDGEDGFVEADQFPPQATSSETFDPRFDETVRRIGPDGSALTFEFPITQETELVGRPTVEIPVKQAGQGGEFEHRLHVTLRHVTSDGVEAIHDQIKPFDVKGEGTISFELNAVQQRLEPGDALQLAVGTNLNPLIERFLPRGGDMFLPSAEGAGVEIDVSGLSLTAPTIRTGEVVEPGPIAERFDPPRDADGDGIYEVVTGDGSGPTVADVQALFQHLDEPAVQDNAVFYNFAGSDPSRVSIFDVQALFYQATS